MRRFIAPSLSLWFFSLPAVLVLVGCGENGPQREPAEEIQDGADPSPQTAALRKKAVDYLIELDQASSAEEEKKVVVDMVGWLNSINRTQSVRLQEEHSQRTSMQDIEAYADSAGPVSLIVEVCCFPPRVEWIKHTFKDNQNIVLFKQVSWTEDIGPETEKKHP